MPGGRWIARCDPRRDRVERVDLSLPGLLVAGAGRLGRCLGAERARGTAVAWLYLCTTLVPTVAVIPAIWVHSGLAWRLCAGAAGPLAILTLALAHGYAAPALD
ncbi:MAG TPA: hypothetical protein VJT31_21300, partial [Rugosimonospora sp.]|nr:hypothetical protein [Rugosimonospora sp.]